MPSHVRHGRGPVPGRTDPHHHIWVLSQNRKVLMCLKPRFGSRQAAHQFYRRFLEESSGYRVLACVDGRRRAECPFLE